MSGSHFSVFVPLRADESGGTVVVVRGSSDG